VIDLHIKHYFSGREYARHMALPAGHYADTHRHTFDHLSILARGQARVTVDGVATDYTGPECIVIRAGQVHRIEALTDVVWFCVHATEELDADKIDHELIKEN
jgi:quercetin dioxygenase-like cupin family protein